MRVFFGIGVGMMFSMYRNPLSRSNTWCDPYSESENFVYYRMKGYRFMGQLSVEIERCAKDGYLRYQEANNDAKKNRMHTMKVF